MADLGDVLSAATQYGNEREAEGAASRDNEVAVLRDSVNRLTATVDAADAALAALQAKYDAYVLAHPDEDPDPDPDPEPAEDLGRIVGGTWLLQQTTSASDGLLSTIQNCFTRVPSAVGFGIRYPLNQVIDSAGNLIVTSSGLLSRVAESVKTVNTQRGKDYKLSLRPINGQYCPPAWKAAMPTELLYTENGRQGIHPCYPDGRPNDIYEGLWRKYLQQLVKWRTDNGYQTLVPFIHGTYYSLEYSEYYNGPATQPAPRGQAKYTQAAHRNAHKRLATIMYEELPTDVAAEWATTGHGPMVETSNPFIQEMADHLVSLYGPGSDRIYFSMNGWSDAKIAGAPDSTTERAKQEAARARPLRIEIQDIAAGTIFPWDTAYDWAIGGVDDKIGTSGMPPRRTLGKNFDGKGDTYLTNGVYPIEIYAFRVQGTTGNAQYSAQLEANAAAHRAHILAL